jgi:hypothetical protein
MGGEKRADLGFKTRDLLGGERWREWSHNQKKGFLLDLWGS